MRADRPYSSCCQDGIWFVGRDASTVVYFDSSISFLQERRYKAEHRQTIPEGDSSICVDRLYGISGYVPY